MTYERTPQNRRKAILFLTVLLGITLLGAYVIGRPFLPMLAYSVILATVFYPLQRRLLRRIHSPHRAALSEDHAKRLLRTLKNSMVANVQGVFAVEAAQGLGTGLALAVLGVSPSTLLGVFAAFCSVIPIFGTALVWGPAAIHLLATGHVIKGLILLGLGAGVISQLDSVVRPLFVGKKVQANALVMMIAMLGGVNAFGFLGLFIGPIVVALMIALSKMLREEIAGGTGGETHADIET